MSMSYWVIEGVGIEVSDVEPYLDGEKLCNMLCEQLPDDERLRSISERKAYNELSYYNYIHGYPFYGLADILTHCDDTDSITYGDDGEMREFFYYPPSMPWHHTENEPQTLQEVHRRIIAAVRKITTLSEQEIDDMIDDELYIVGYG